MRRFLVQRMRRLKFPQITDDPRRLNSATSLKCLKTEKYKQSSCGSNSRAWCWQHHDHGFDSQGIHKLIMHTSKVILGKSICQMHTCSFQNRKLLGLKWISVSCASYRQQIFFWRQNFTNVTNGATFFNSKHQVDIKLVVCNLYSLQEDLLHHVEECAVQGRVVQQRTG